MESCLLITNNKKSKEKKNKVLFIDARKELQREKTISYLLPEHISKIYKTYKKFKNIENFSYVANLDEIISKDASLNMSLYVKNIDNELISDLPTAYTLWEKSDEKLIKSIDQLTTLLKN